jgi:hypothetical protein
MSMPAGSHTDRPRVACLVGTAKRNADEVTAPSMSKLRQRTGAILDKE